MNLIFDRGSPWRKTSFRDNVSLWLSIHKNLIFDRGDASHNPVNPYIGKPHFSHDYLNEWPFHAIVWFTHIRFYGQSLNSSTCLGSQCMEHLLSYHDIICNMSSSNKGWLGFRYPLWEDLLQSLAFFPTSYLYSLYVIF